MVTSSVLPIGHSGNGSAYLTISEASNRFGVSPQSLRRWADSGKLACATSVGGHRRFRAGDLAALLGVQSEGEGLAEGECQGAGKIALLARVSSDKQGRGFDTAKGERKDGATTQSDLERQTVQLKTYAKNKYGVEGVLYSDIGSGLNFTRKNFTRLLEEICGGKWNGGTVVVTHKDRAMRFGYEMFETVCRVNGVTIDIMDRQNEVSDETEMADDILSVITHFSARKHGARSAVNNTFILTASALELATELRNAKYPLAHIRKVLTANGHVMTNGRGEVRPVTKHVLERLFDGNGVETLINEVLPTEEGGKVNFERFAEQHLRATEEGKVSAKEVYRAYKRWCLDNDETECSRVVVGRYMKANFKRYESNGRTMFKGCQIA